MCWLRLERFAGAKMALVLVTWFVLVIHYGFYQMMDNSLLSLRTQLVTKNWAGPKLSAANVGLPQLWVRIFCWLAAPRRQPPYTLENNGSGPICEQRVILRWGPLRWKLFNSGRSSGPLVQVQTTRCLYPDCKCSSTYLSGQRIHFKIRVWKYL